MTTRGAAPSQEVVSLAARGRKIEAIKAYRVQTGAGLAEAKRAVESLDLSAVTGSTPERKNGAPNAALVLGVTVFAAIVTAALATGVVRSALTHDWIEVRALVTHSHIGRRSGASPTVRLEYRYEIDGAEYLGERIAYAEIRGPWFTDRTHARYPEGSTHSAWYDPDDLTRAVLERSVPIPYYAGLFVAAGALAWGVTSWRELARHESESKRRLSV